MNKFWNELSKTAKISFLGGVFLILVLTLLAGLWFLRVDYQVLFADLKAQDSAVMVDELDRLKIPYKISDDGNSILVDKSIVHSTRLKLLGKELPLNGVVGLELFNNSDFGMTEFAQKINYQRALQGELTRTISSLDEIQDVRVHLALPEEGLFKRATSKPKAAITVALKAGKSLRNEQVLGIQRLVAAAVPGIIAQDVTIVDKKGVALTRPMNSNDQDLNSNGLLLKKDTETVLIKKVNDVLAKTFGEDQVSVSVDVILNLDQIKITTEDVLAAPNANGQTTGVIVKDKESSRDVTAPLDALNGATVPKSGSSQREVEYQVGRRVEQIVSHPGAIKRLSAVAVIQKELSEQQIEQVKAMVSAAVGAIAARGDQIVVQSANGLGQKFESTEEALTISPSSEKNIAADKTNSESTNNKINPFLVESILFVILLIILSTVVFIRRPKAPKKMTEIERELALKSICEWLNLPSTADRSSIPSEGKKEWN